VIVHTLPNYRAGTFVPTLTGVRAIAAFLVLAYHVNQRFFEITVVNNSLVRRGYLGVDLFFILSGFIIAHVYSQHLVPLRIRNVGIFLWHRFIRLYPAYATVLTLLIVMVVVLRSLGIPVNIYSHLSWNYGDLPWYFLLLQAWRTMDTMSWNTPSWSISAEWFAYLTFPMVILAVFAVRRQATLILAVAMLVLLAVIFAISGWSIERTFLGGLPALTRVECEFVCGVLLQHAIATGTPSNTVMRMADLFTIGGMFGFVAGAALHSPDYILIFMLAILIFGLSRPGPIGRAIFARKSVIWIGEISYSLYIIHWPALLILRYGLEKLHIEWSDGVIGRGATLVFCITVVLAGASTLYYAVEYPARRHLRNLCGTMKPTSVSASISA
jgi:peptidoglycan/LPS O-acetylase OafA/YrhL